MALAVETAVNIPGCLKLMTGFKTCIHRIKQLHVCIPPRLSSHRCPCRACWIKLQRENTSIRYNGCESATENVAHAIMRFVFEAHTSQFLPPDALTLILCHVQRRRPEMGHDHQELLKADLLDRALAILMEVSTMKWRKLWHFIPPCTVFVPLMMRKVQATFRLRSLYLLSKKASMICERIGLHARSGIPLKWSLLRAGKGF